MTLLVITNNPERASFRQRIAVYLGTLEEAGVECRVEVLPTGSLQRRMLFRSARYYDGVFLHKKGLNFIDAWFLRRHCRRLIYNFDDAVMLSEKRPERVSRAHFTPFKRSATLADMIIVGSEYLAAQARPFNSCIHVLPLGLQTDIYHVSDARKAKGSKIRLLWVGSNSTLAYLDMIRPALEQVGRTHADLILRIVADDKWLDFPSLEVEHLRWTKERRGENMADCTVALAPLPDNPFTRGKCSFKVLEYSAAGLPVVASPVGTNGIYVNDKKTGNLAKTMDEWVACLTHLIENPDVCRIMGQAGREWARQYDTKVIGSRLCELIKCTLA